MSVGLPADIPGEGRANGGVETDGLLPKGMFQFRKLSKISTQQYEVIPSIHIMAKRHIIAQEMGLVFEDLVFDQRSRVTFRQGTHGPLETSRLHKLASIGGHTVFLLRSSFQCLLTDAFLDSLGNILSETPFLELVCVGSWTGLIRLI